MNFQVKTAASGIMQTLRTSNAIQKIIFAAGEINEARFLAASWKWNAITSGIVFAASSGCNFYKWCRGDIAFKQFMKLELVQAGEQLEAYLVAWQVPKLD